MSDGFTLQVTNRGPQPQKGGEYPTWRIELLDEKGKPTDIWSDCWQLEDGSWMSSYLSQQSLNLITAMQFGLRSIMEYCGLDQK